MSEQQGPDTLDTAEPTGAKRLDPTGGKQPEPVQRTPVAARTPLQLAFARLRRDKVAIGAAILLIILILLALLAPVIAKVVGHGPNQQLPSEGLTPDGFPVNPNSSFLLGADQLGRDVLVRTLY